MVSEVLLTSSNQAIQVEFTDACKAELWVVDDMGEIVFDSRLGKTCTPIDLELTVSADEP